MFASSFLFFCIFSTILFFFFFFNDTATTEIYTLSLHDALPICDNTKVAIEDGKPIVTFPIPGVQGAMAKAWLNEENQRSEEHTSELQSLTNLVCRLLLEKKKKTKQKQTRKKKKR